MRLNRVPSGKPVSTVAERKKRYTCDELEEILAYSPSRGLWIVDEIADEIRQAPLLSVGLAFALGILFGAATSQGS
jgi:hypothetical protein